MTDKHNGTCFCGAVERRGDRRARGDGLLPLQLLPLLVGGPGQCLHAVEARERQGDRGAEHHRRLREDAERATGSSARSAAAT